MQASELFRQNVRAVMARKGIKAAALGRLTEIKESNMSRILGGTEGVTIDRAERIAIALDIPLCELFVEVGQKINETLDCHTISCIVGGCN